MTSTGRAKSLVGVCVVLATMAAAPSAASAEIRGKCSQAVGTFLTKNALDNDGRTSTSRSLLVLTNGGHALRFDSDEGGAAMDSRPFGNSAGTWRCDGVDKDGTVRLTAAMLDFTYPDAEGDEQQIARIEMSGTYVPKAETMELAGRLGFLPFNADAQKANEVSRASSTTLITLRATRIELPPAE
jgi:hypothetical protein